MATYPHGYLDAASAVGLRVELVEQGLAEGRDEASVLLDVLKAQTELRKLEQWLGARLESQR